MEDKCETCRWFVPVGKREESSFGQCMYDQPHPSFGRPHVQNEDFCRHWLVHPSVCKDAKLPEPYPD